jgi:hypothetical protein
VRLAKALPFQRAQVEMRDTLTVHDDLHTADGAHAQVAMVSSNTARPGRGYATYATAVGGVQGLQALSLRHWPPLGAFIKLPGLRVVHDFYQIMAEDHVRKNVGECHPYREFEGMQPSR